ncbi:hypothetical protein [Cupriavidus sp. AU9028]|uniref:hypothetical protein n=1 Tax=Cupriavidus sp. AU9028 TaxID=2871157 RepID=UPI001C96AB20|nr:hypothetical protein [Cupriavidus sp. AU9028]MBY4897160.1 hypothetical protein [Cupriavidus sp. AU9028]
MSDGKLGIAGTTFIAFTVAGVALAASLYLAYLSMPPRGRSMVRKVLDHDSPDGTAAEPAAATQEPVRSY